MAKTVPVRDDFEPLFYDEMGRLVVTAGRVEYSLKLCLKRLVGKGFTAGMLEAEKVRHLSSLCDEVEKLAKSKLNGDEQKNFCALAHRIRSLADQRHDMVHALWTTTGLREPLRVRPQLTEKKDPRSVDWSKTKVVTLNELRVLRRHLEDAYVSLQDQRKTWP
jgi:hypothetical protein